jgi:peptide/nickel transport system permease protein
VLPFITRRIAGVVPVALLVVVFVFLLLRLSPGDPAAIIAGDSATTEQVERVREALGLNLPLLQQFLIFAGQLAHGDLGRSVFSNLPVTTLIAQRIVPTFTLAATTMVLASCVAIPLGILAAARAGHITDRLVMLLAVLAFSFPVFWTGYALVLLFSVDWRLLPVQGFSPLSDGIGPFVAHLVLPTITLGLAFMALLTRMTRGAMLEVLGQDYIRTARAKGLSRWSVLFVHALKNAGVPIVTTIGLGIGVLLGGTVVTESVFAIPGLGRLAVDAIVTKDYPVIQGLILFFSGVYVVLNLLIDLSYSLLDPRLRDTGLRG